MSHIDSKCRSAYTALASHLIRSLYLSTHSRTIRHNIQTKSNIMMKFIALLVISAVLASAASAAPANVTVTGYGRVQHPSDTVSVSTLGKIARGSHHA